MVVFSLGGSSFLCVFVHVACCRRVSSILVARVAVVPARPSHCFRSFARRKTRWCQKGEVAKGTLWKQEGVKQVRRKDVIIEPKVLRNVKQDW